MPCFGTTVGYLTFKRFQMEHPVDCLCQCHQTNSLPASVFPFPPHHIHKSTLEMFCDKEAEENASQKPHKIKAKAYVTKYVLLI